MFGYVENVGQETLLEQLNVEDVKAKTLDLRRKVQENSSIEEFFKTAFLFVISNFEGRFVRSPRPDPIMWWARGDLNPRPTGLSQLQT